MTRTKFKRWLWPTAVICTIGIALVAWTRSGSSFGKITIVRGLELHGPNRPGNADTYPAHFRFENRQHKLLSLNPVNVVWRFMVLTNDTQGSFVQAFEPEPVEFRTPDDGGHYEFWLRDSRLLDCEWKLQVTRAFRYRMPSPINSLWRSIRTPADTWETDTMHRSISNWKWEANAEASGVFHFPDHPIAVGATPDFLTNGGSLFGAEIRYLPRDSSSPTYQYKYAPEPDRNRAPTK